MYLFSYHSESLDKVFYVVQPDKVAAAVTIWQYITEYIQQDYQDILSSQITKLAEPGIVVEDRDL